MLDAYVLCSGYAYILHVSYITNLLFVCTEEGTV